MESPYHRFHRLSDLNNMTVGIVEPHHALSPGLFTNGMDEFDPRLIQPLVDRLQLVSLEI